MTEPLLQRAPATEDCTHHACQLQWCRPQHHACAMQPPAFTACTGYPLLSKAQPASLTSAPCRQLATAAHGSICWQAHACTTRRCKNATKHNQMLRIETCALMSSISHTSCYQAASHGSLMLQQQPATRLMQQQLVTQFSKHLGAAGTAGDAHGHDMPRGTLTICWTGRPFTMYAGDAKLSPSNPPHPPAARAMFEAALGRHLALRRCICFKIQTLTHRYTLAPRIISWLLMSSL